MLLRRLFVLLTLMFWQGGFMFYGGVVVPVGADILGSDREQGFITQRVTDYLNAAGAVALLVWGWDTAAGRGRRIRWAAWGLLVAMLGVQVGLHPRMDALLAADEGRVLDRPAFRRLHQGYLLASTVQWAAALGLLAATLRAWRAEDDPSRVKR
ncbi:hypothetical protein [Limnoglobus roseus]|uniref:DUF4149 domain-containing protein n=1 Tax=Limnoglobus roseus TaxID=2598579 RepID=A0A5C1AAT1_9BACT|nr:hypothetical protein [Limnoglobus roseus]QEL15327.1 hypothetical protein PX52LOC_02242 [Limnoglobus roseus]